VGLSLVIVQNLHRFSRLNPWIWHGNYIRCKGQGRFRGWLFWATAGGRN